MLTSLVVRLPCKTGMAMQSTSAGAVGPEYETRTNSYTCPPALDEQASRPIDKPLARRAQREETGCFLWDVMARSPSAGRRRASSGYRDRGWPRGWKPRRLSYGCC